jgi:molybdopterin-dependent oxidoreductase alpha subunit
MAKEQKIGTYSGPSGGWGSARSVTEILLREHIPVKGASVLLQQNKPGGFACVGCSYAKPKHPKTFEFCENGAKATAWEITDNRCTPEFFADHTVTELEAWSDYDLEELGRLTEPMRWDALTDTYVQVSWADAFAEIGAQLKTFDAKSVVFYASGRASLEASYLYQLLARMYGNNNLPDSSNMCHESTSVALPQTIGVPVGTVKLEDFDETDCILFLGQNVGVNSPRMLHQLQAARRRGVPIVTFNPLRERGLERFTNPQSPLEMATLAETDVSTQYLQLNPGGDLAALAGIAKYLLDRDRAHGGNGAKRAIDHAFIAEHCAGWEDFVAAIDAFSWERIEACSGLKRWEIEAAAQTYAEAKSVIACYGMGLTQHRSGVLAIQMLSNILLMRGNIGRPGAGIFPVRGHSNVQGQRTVGITEKPELAPLDRLAQQFGFSPPRERGLNTVETCEQVLSSRISGFIALGGNFIRAIPETDAMEAAWRKLPLTVQVITKLNRGAVIHGRSAYLLPCLGRIEVDEQANGKQFVTIEDTTGRFHASHGQVPPASTSLLSEPAIVAGLAKACLAPNAKINWDAFTGDYALIRDAIAESYPDIFARFNARIEDPEGFDRPLPARERKWATKNGKANFVTPRSLSEDPDIPCCRENVLTLITVRSNDQFNTTIYGYADRLRGINGTRRVALMNGADMRARGLRDGDVVDLIGDAGDDVVRRVDGMRATEFDVPKGSCAGYFPECNALLPLWHHAEGSKVPAAKSIPVRIEPAGAGPQTLHVSDHAPDQIHPRGASNVASTVQAIANAESAVKARLNAASDPAPSP